MPGALIIPSIMLRLGQNGMNAMSSSYDWMRQRRKRRAGCRSSLQPAHLGRKSIAAQTSPVSPLISYHWTAREAAPRPLWAAE